MPARYETLAEWANKFDWTFGAELGVSDGRTHIHLLNNCPRLHLVGFDIWDLPGVKQGATVSGERCQCQYCTETRLTRRATTVGQREAGAKNLSRPTGRSTLYKMPASDGARMVPDGSVDFVFVDADHSTEGVRGDILVWRPKIKPGGRMVGHDANMKSVMDGVLSCYDAYDINFEDDHLWWVQIE